MQKILVVEDAEPELRLMVWLLTDDGSDVKVTSSIGEVIADIERYAPDTVVFNSRMRGQRKDACIALIRDLVRDVRIIDVSAAKTAAEATRLIDVTDHDELDAARVTADDAALSNANLIYMVNHKRFAT
jgi:DNA-binding NtrC family response regulator